MGVSSNLQTQPAWLDTFPDEDVAFGFDGSGMWFSGDASGAPYPVRINYDIDSDTTVVVVYTFVYADVDDGCPDHGICFFKADVEPYWNWGTDVSRIAIQYDCGQPIIEGQNENGSGSEYDLTLGNTYTARVTYNPVEETVTHELFDGSGVSGSPIDTITLTDERLPAGSYRVGFHADLDSSVPDKAYFTYLEISEGSPEIFTHVFRSLHFPHRRREVISEEDLTPKNVQPGEVLLNEDAAKLYAGLDDGTVVEITGGTQSNAVVSNATGITGATVVTNIVKISQANYDALPTKDATTLYIING